MKDFIITVVAILGIVAVILVVIAIGNNVSLRPSMLLTSEACDAPCWYGIQPGVTKPQEAYDILSEIDVITNKSIYGDYERDGTVTSWYWFFKRPASDGGGTVYFSDDRATAISLLTAN
ncbi:MAG: hypothetical protein FP831_07600 [Anaerolineae bacterium]|nr:hypothetical protein [Anaerolineae bacterium]